MTIWVTIFRMLAFSLAFGWLMRSIIKVDAPHLIVSLAVLVWLYKTEES